MTNNNTSGRSIIARLLAFISILMMVFGFILFMNIFGGAFMTLILGKIPGELDFSGDETTRMLTRKALLIGQIGGTILALILMPLLYLFYFKKSLIPAVFALPAKNTAQFFAIALLVTMTVLPLIGVIGDWNKNIQFPESMEALNNSMHQMEDKATMMTDLIINYEGIADMMIVLFAVALLPAISEELLFRGLLQNEMFGITRNVHVAVLISATVFSFIHFQFLGFFPRMLLGIVLGYLYVTSGNLLVPILMHFTNNAMAVIVKNLHTRGVIKVDPDSAKDIPQASVYVSIVLSLALMYYCWKLYKQRINGQENNVIVS